MSVTPHHCASRMTRLQPGIVAAASLAGRLSEWLLADGAKIPTVKELIEQLSARLNDERFPIFRLLISSAFPQCFPGEMRSRGTHSLKGVSEPQESFALTH